jgi:hypothetical protein
MRFDPSPKWRYLPLNPFLFWTKPQRGLKGRSQELIDIHNLYYNLIRPHMALQDKTPIKTDKDGRWLSFLIDKKRSKQMKASSKNPFSD